MPDAVTAWARATSSGLFSRSHRETYRANESGSIGASAGIGTARRASCSAPYGTITESVSWRTR